jgi:ComF family protein
MSCFRLAGRLLYEKISILEPALIIPVPISRERRSERGYNQVECMADEIEKLDRDRIFEIRKDIMKRKHAPPQTSLSRRERLANLKGMFTADEVKVRGKNIIILDDVITTGATMAEIRSVLIKSGARKVTAVALAH